MFDSMWGSMASSLQLAEECLKEDQEEEIEAPNRSEGIKKLANLIDAGNLIFLKFLFRSINVIFTPR